MDLDEQRSWKLAIKRREDANMNFEQKKTNKNSDFSRHFALRREQSTPQTRILSLIHFFPAYLC